MEYFLDCDAKVLNKRLSVIKHGSWLLKKHDEW